MSTESEKKQNQIRLVNMALLGLAAGTWDVLGKGVNAFSGPMGDEILKVIEQEMGLKIAGEDPTTVMTEISRVFIDEYGFASDIEVSAQDGEHFQLRVRNCVNSSFTDKLLAAGVEKPFICPIMNACRAALRRAGYKTHENIERWMEGQGSIITFTTL